MRFWLVDTFTTTIFAGNPAAVCLLEKKLETAVLQKIAREFNVHETIFVSPLQNQHFQINWFTPFANESVCGHGLLAAAHVLWQELKFEDIDDQTIYFDTPNGIFMITKEGKKISIHLPLKQAEQTPAPERLINALGFPPISVSKCGQIYLVEMFNVKQVFKLEPDIAKLGKIPCSGVVVTAEGNSDVSYDFASRFFAPNEGFQEDPVTVWNHCFLGDYWKKRLNKDVFTAFQEADRGGILDIVCNGDQTIISGECITSMYGEVCNMNNWAFNDNLFDD